jgi:hypothetical protein
VKLDLANFLSKLTVVSAASFLSGLFCFSSWAENSKQIQINSFDNFSGKTNGKEIKQKPILLTQRQDQRKRVALVIGNSNYQRGSKLRNAVNDANDIANNLRKLNFEVILLTDANLRKMDQALESFYQKLNRGSVGLFYYAGHGVQVNGENYLVPIDADLARESEVDYEAVPVGKLLGAMQDLENEVNIIILDACRDNPFARSWTRSSGGKGLAPIQNSVTGSFIAYATGPGNVAQDGNGRNGTFTSALLKHLTNPNQTLEEMFKKVRVEVAQATGNDQVPWTTSSLIGDFYFSSNSNSNSNDQITTPQPIVPPKKDSPSAQTRKPSVTPPTSQPSQDVAYNKSNSPFQDLTGEALTPRTISILRSFLAGHKFKEAFCDSSQHKVTITLNDRYVACAEGNSTYPSGDFSFSVGDLK